jgi:hypothetical protein
VLVDDDAGAVGAVKLVAAEVDVEAVVVATETVAEDAEPTLLVTVETEPRGGELSLAAAALA